jgi:hypothetical protein
VELKATTRLPQGKGGIKANAAAQPVFKKGGFKDYF